MSNAFDEFNSWKTLLYADKCKAILRGKFESPVVLHVYPTNLCNSNCNFCIMKQEQMNQVSLSEDIFQRLIDSANSMGIKSIHVSGGGEPTLYPHLHHVQKFEGFKVLSTNGIALTPGLASMFNRVRVSLNAGTAQTHRLITRTHGFEQIVKNIQEVKLWCCKKVVLGLGFVLSYDNWQDVFPFCKLADELRVDFVHIRPAYFRDKEQDEKVRAIIEPAYHLCEAARKLTKTRLFSISEKFEGYWSERQYKRCLASPLHGVVTATGELIVCQDVFIRFGDLYHLTLEDIWGSEEHKRAIAEIDIEDCPRCVMNKPNEIMEHVFVEDKILSELL